MVYDLLVYPWVMLVLAAFEGRVVVHFNHAGIPVVIFDIHAVQAPPDCVCGIEPGPYDMRGDIPLGDTLYPAIDDMPVDGGLDLERDRRDRIFADIEELPVEDADTPVVLALHVLLDYDPVREPDNPAGHPEEARDIG